MPDVSSNPAKDRLVLDGGTRSSMSGGTWVVGDAQRETEAERAAFSFRSTSYTFGREVSNERTGIICHA
jgi:hypothetical protein